MPHGLLKNTKEHMVYTLREYCKKKPTLERKKLPKFFDIQPTGQT